MNFLNYHLNQNRIRLQFLLFLWYGYQKLLMICPPYGKLSTSMYKQKRVAYRKIYIRENCIQISVKNLCPWKFIQIFFYRHLKNGCRLILKKDGRLCSGVGEVWFKEMRKANPSTCISVKVAQTGNSFISSQNTICWTDNKVSFELPGQLGGLLQSWAEIDHYLNLQCSC